jgi:hypothetical protein
LISKALSQAPIQDAGVVPQVDVIKKRLFGNFGLHAPKEVKP